MIDCRAGAEDAEALARPNRRTVWVSLTFLAELHTGQEDLRFFADKLRPDNEEKEPVALYLWRG